MKDLTIGVYWLWGKDTWYNDGCGWSETSQKAFEKAIEHYNQLIEEN